MDAHALKAHARPTNRLIELTVQTSFSEKVAASEPLSSSVEFDPSIPLASRLTTTPNAVLQRFRGSANSTITPHQLSTAERAKVDGALQQLPGFARQAFLQHVRSISFLEGMPSNGTTIKEDGTAGPVFDVVLRASILNESISDFLTRKERNCYSATDSTKTLSVDAGPLPALLYVLLHESVHIVDISNRDGQAGPPRLFTNGAPNRLVQGIWRDATTKEPAHGSPLLEGTWFRTGKPASIDLAETTYVALARSPFVSLYGSSNWYDDVAELVTCYYLTQKMHQPYRIVLRKGSDVLYSLDPMNSKLVTERFAAVAALFE
jgi:hypothetical protein